jgi:hypothetical protein
VPFGLIANHLRDRITDRAIEFTDDNFGFGGRPRWFGLNECFACPHYDSTGTLLFDCRFFFLCHDSTLVDGSCGNLAACRLPGSQCGQKQTKDINREMF